MTRQGIIRSFGTIAPLVLLACSAALAQSREERNIGASAKRLLAATDTWGSVPDATHARLAFNAKTRTYAVTAGKRNVIVDDQRRVLIRLVLDGATASEAIEKEVAELGGKMVARDQQLHNRIVSAYLPVEQIRTSATLAGVKAVHLEETPVLNAGSVTSQAVQSLHVDKVLSAGYSGKGVTIGLLSDSYNTTRSIGNPDTALSDVLSGDLPDRTTLHGEEGLKFALDNENGPATDEGRAMAQVVHDMAPKAELCFATGFVGPASFAESIVTLRIDPRCSADIIVDDVSYGNEPFFSDGPIAKAVDLVVNSKSLPGKPVSYFSAAGNNLGRGAYAGIFHPVTPAIAKKLLHLPIDLTTIPKYVNISGGFQNFNSDPTGKPVIAQKIQIIGSNPIILQWDDLFDQGAITTDYNLLVFDGDGKYDGDLSSADDNFATDEPLESIDLEAFYPTTYYLVIARAGGGVPVAPAKRLKYINLSNGAGVLTGQDVGGSSTPLVFGHAAARGAITVAAYNVSRAPFGPNPPYVPEIESYSSVGPVLIAFDSNGKRLPSPELRSKPNVACADGVFTTFFGQYVLSSDLYPRFFGTSAAAPCAAGIGALMLEKSERERNPLPLSPAGMATLLKASGASRSFDPFSLTSVAEIGAQGVFDLTASGPSSPTQQPTQFFLHFAAPGKTLYSLTLSIPAQDDTIFYLNSQTAAGAPNPLLLGPSSPGVFLRSSKPSSANAQILSPTFTLFFGNFHSGDFFQFGIDRTDAADLGFLDDQADRINGTRYIAIFTDKTKAEGTLSQAPHAGYSIYDGHGLIDAQRAIALVP